MSQLVIYKNESGKLEGFISKANAIEFKLAGLFHRQEVFGDQGRLLDWLKVGAGHVDLVPGRDGVMVAWKYRGAAA